MRNSLWTQCDHCIRKDIQESYRILNTNLAFLRELEYNKYKELAVLVTYDNIKVYVAVFIYC